MTITGLLIVGAIGYGLWYLGGAFCKWRTQKFFNSRAWDPSRENWQTASTSSPSSLESPPARSGATI